MIKRYLLKNQLFKIPEALKYNFKHKLSQSFTKSPFQPSTILRKPQTGLIYNVPGRALFCLQSCC